MPMKTAWIRLLNVAFLPLVSWGIGNAQPAPGPRPREPYPPELARRQYPEAPGSYVTDLRPILRELARHYPEHNSEIVKQAEKLATPTKARLELRRIVTDNARETEGVTSIVAIGLHPSLAMAYGAFHETIIRLSAAFDRFPKEKGPLGELAVTYTFMNQSSTVILLRRNAVVWVRAEGLYRGSKTDTSGIYLPDPGLEDRAIALARTIDQLLISAK
jgi:hypothetical protein